MISECCFYYIPLSPSIIKNKRTATLQRATKKCLQDSWRHFLIDNCRGERVKSAIENDSRDTAPHTRNRLQSLLHREHVSAKTEHRAFGINLAEALQDERHLSILTHRENGAVHSRPGVASVVRFTIDSATTLNILKTRKSAHHRTVQCRNDIIAMSLIVGNKYSFHYLRFLNM